MYQHTTELSKDSGTLTDATVCQLVASKLSEEFWEESARCANYVINRQVDAHPEENPHFPYQVYFSETSRISHFRIFGFVCYIKDLIAPKQPRQTGTRGIFVVYPERQTAGYRIYLPDSDKFIASVHIEISNADNLFQGLQLTKPSNDPGKDIYDAVICDATGLQPSKELLSVTFGVLKLRIGNAEVYLTYYKS